MRNMIYSTSNVIIRSRIYSPKAVHCSSSSCTILPVCLCVSVASWLNLISIVQCKDQDEGLRLPSLYTLFLLLSENIIN